MNTRLVHIAPQMLAEAWPQIGAFVAQMADRSSDKFMTADLIKAVSLQQMQLWAVVTEEAKPLGCAMSETITFPRRKVSRMIGGTGKDIGLWLDHIPTFEDWARSIGCSANEALARPGWEKVLAPLGYKKTHVLLEKQL